MGKDIKNLKEVLALLQLLTTETCKAIGKDGFQPKDLLAFLEAEDFNEKLQAAMEDFSEVAGEAMDVGLLEGIDLARTAQRIITEAVAALKVKA